MYRPNLVTCLSLCSLTAFAFDPCGSRWHGSSEIAPTITFASYKGSGIAAVRNPTYPYLLHNSNKGEFSLAGIELKQSVGWSTWATLDFYGSFAQSSVATSVQQEYGYYYNSYSSGAQPAGLSLWDLGVEAFTSISLDSKKEVWLEPAIGYSLVNANMQNASLDNPKKNWEELKFYGPSLGLYLRLFLSPRVSIRMGGGYMASRLKLRNYTETRSNTSYPITGGDFAGSYQFHNRRHGLFGLARLDYLWKSWVQLYSAVDFRSYSAGGPSELLQAPDYIANYAPPLEVPIFKRTRFSWGVNFVY